MRTQKPHLKIDVILGKGEAQADHAWCQAMPFPDTTQVHKAGLL